MILTAAGLSKTFPRDSRGEQQVLRGIDLCIQQGEFVAIMGASGSGKSTLLYTLSGMLRPTTGIINFAEVTLAHLTEAELARLRLQRMGFVFQQANLLKNFTLKDNIILAPYLEGLTTPAQLEQRAVELMQQVGVADLADKDISQASGGQLQRVAICRALLNEPELLFCDEPTGALNSQAAADIMELFSEINQRGTTILLVTHDPKVAARAERLLLLADGELVGERSLGKLTTETEFNSRVEQVTAWLQELGI